MLSMLPPSLPGDSAAEEGATVPADRPRGVEGAEVADRGRMAPGEPRGDVSADAGACTP